MARTLEPRKRPTTDQAKRIVEALIDATATLLAERGYERTTTNRIAERAGVSVGSLYQYFPNKQSLVAEVARRQQTSYDNVFRAALLHGTQHACLESAARTVIGALASDAAGAHEMRQAVADSVPREWSRNHRLRLEQDATRSLARALAQLTGLPEQKADQRAFVILQAVQAVIEASIWHDGALGHDVLVEELVALVCAYAAHPHQHD